MEAYPIDFLGGSASQAGGADPFAVHQNRLVAPRVLNHSLICSTSDFSQKISDVVKELAKQSGEKSPGAYRFMCSQALECLKQLFFTTS